MHMQRVLILGTVVLAATLAGCASELSTSNFELKATQIGWKIGQDAIFLLRFDPKDADEREYTIDPTFAVTEVRFEKDGLNAFGDYSTKRASDVALTILRGGEPVGNYTLTPSASQISLQVKIPDKLDNGEYRLELNLFKVGWIKSDVFRVAVG